MTRRLTSPITLPLTALVLGLGWSLLVLLLTLGQPWQGLRLAPDPARPAGLQILDVAAGSPAESAGLRPGQRLLQIGDLPVEAGDLLEEPDMLPDFAGYDQFMARQGRLATALRAPEGTPIRLEAATPFVLTPDEHRPVGSLPAVFWVQLFVGTFGFVAGAWVLGVRGNDLPAGFLFLAGVGLLVSAHAAAIYSSRELALPQQLFRWLSGINHLGAITFGVGMIGLFLVYPIRLVRPVWIWLPALLLWLWWGANQARLLPSPAIGFQLPVALALLSIAVCVGLQYHATRADPRARAALRWFGLAVLTGAGAFVVTVILPILLGFSPAMPQGLAFLFFLPIYGGLALGVARYRLFEIEDWAFRILFYLAGMLLLLALDALLIAVIAVERSAAFGLSLLAVALIYLPLRSGLARRLLGEGRGHEGALFRAVTDVALTPPGGSRQARWQQLLEEEFRPLQVERLPVPPSGVQLADDGAALDLPAVDTMPALRLVWARHGRALFSPRDLSRAQEMVTMLAEASASRRAYETGVAEERARIAQDMHDNIGIQLMGALHSASVGRKDALIRETLSDLRDIVSNANRAELSLDEMLADLRATLGEHLSAAGMELDWQLQGLGPAQLAPRLAHATRSILREAVGNALRHSGGRHVLVQIDLQPDRLVLTVEDDGRGLSGAVQGNGGGNGLANIRARAAGQGGAVEIGASGAGGMRIRVDLPVQGEGVKS